MEFETEREISHPAASNHGQHNGTGRDDSEGTNGSILSSTSRRASQNYSSNGETVVNSEYSEVVNSRNTNKVDDGREWLDHELERIHHTGPSHGSGNGNGNSGITSGHLSGGGHILTVSSNAPHDLYAIHSTDSNRIALLNNVLSTHLDTMGGDNEAANYTDRVAYLSASTVTSSAAASSTAAAAAVSSSSRHGPSRRLGKRSRDSSDMDGDTLTGDGSPPPTQDVGRPSKSKSKSKAKAKAKAKAKGKAKETSNDVDAGSPAKKVCSGHQDNQNDDEDLRFVNGCNRYSKNMKTPEPFPHDRPPVSFEDDYRANLAISMQGATGEEDMPPITQAEQSSAVPLHQVPSTPPMRPLPAIPTAAPTTQTMPTAPSEPVMQPFGTTQPPMLHPDQTQQQHIRSYQSMQNMHAMRALQDMQTMGAMHGMQAMHPIPPQGLPTPTYDNNSAYMGYTFVPPQTSQHHGHQQHSFCGHGGLQSPDDEFIAIDNCLDMSTAPGIPMDFTDPDEIQRIMGFCENLGGSTHAVFDSMDDFQWI
ncbi:hypothetical protein Sste5346_004681 [Sporothrix stenoceras]|uniref:Uncharacterized protein n=1 Tax=Sporothrix stenoceras TaxID=5173 RepID=A0ABR3Z6U6_9PEZI